MKLNIEVDLGDFMEYYGEGFESTVVDTIKQEIRKRVSSEAKKLVSSDRVLRDKLLISFNKVIDEADFGKQAKMALIKTMENYFK